MHGAKKVNAHDMTMMLMLMHIDSPAHKVLLKEVTAISLIYNLRCNHQKFVRSEIIGGLKDLPGNIKAVLAQDDKVGLKSD